MVNSFYQKQGNCHIDQIENGLQSHEGHKEEKVTYISFIPLAKRYHLQVKYMCQGNTLVTSGHFVLCQS